MDEIDNNTEEDEDFEDEPLEQMLMLLNSVVKLLVSKGILTQEEIETEMDNLYDELDKFNEES